MLTITLNGKCNTRRAHYTFDNDVLVKFRFEELTNDEWTTVDGWDSEDVNVEPPFIPDSVLTQLKEQTS